MSRVLCVFALLCPTLAQAAGLNGAELSLLWSLPFAGLLLSIALFPIFAPAFWHHHFGKIALGWALAFLLPALLVYGHEVAGSGDAEDLDAIRRFAVAWLRNEQNQDLAAFGVDFDIYFL